MPSRSFKNPYTSFLTGQSISVSIACTSLFTQFLANRNVYLAFTQNFGNYILLAFFLLFRFAHSKKALQIAWWKYIIVAVIDAEANFLVVKAYEYTTILSIMLCDVMSIPAVVVLSLIFLHTQYNWKHYLSVVLCLIGIVIMIILDYQKGSAEGVHRWVGDLMALGAALLYAISNICQEVFVKTDDWREFLGMIGVGGSVVTLSQLLLFERNALINVSWDVPTVLFLLGYIVSLLLMYVITAVSLFLEWNDAVVLNMHLLTSDIIAAVLTYFFFDDPPTTGYFLALAITIVGVVIYNREPPKNDLSDNTMKIEPKVEGEGEVKEESKVEIQVEPKVEVQVEPKGEVKGNKE